jgi:hypothetical protein
MTYGPRLKFLLLRRTTLRMQLLTGILEMEQRVPKRALKKVYNTGGSKLVKLSVTRGDVVKTETKTIMLDGAFTKVTITALKVVGYPASFSTGTGWDPGTSGTVYTTGAPDMYLVGRLAGQSLDAVYTTIKTNVSPSQVASGAINWTMPYSAGGLYSRVFSTSEFGTVLDLQLMDSDDGTNYWSSIAEKMGVVTIKFSDFMTLSNKYPATVTRQGSGSINNSALKLELTLKWE